MTENKVVPKLRFRDFSDCWKKKKLKEIILEFIVPMRDKPRVLIGEIPWCRIEDFDGKYLSKSKSNQGVTQEVVKKMNLKVYPTNTVLVSCSANLGFCAITQRPLVTNQTFIGLVPSEFIDSEYLLYLMRLSSRKLNILSSGTTISYLSKKEFEKFQLHIPSLPEQKKIASFLSSVDDKIQKLNRKKELLQQYKKGVMQKIFSQELRFKDDNGNDYPDWEEKKLGEVCVIKKGKQLNKSELTETGLYPALNGGVNPSGYTNKWNTEKDVITISEGGNSCGYVGLSKTRFWCGGHCYSLLDLDADINFNYIFQILKFLEVQIMRLRVGSGLPNIQMKEITKFLVSIPAIKEQNKIANFLSSIDKKIDLVSNQLENTKVFKKGLLQQMFV